MKKTAIIYSSLTGNTKKVAVAISQVTGDNNNLFTTKEFETIDLALYDNIILGFWVDKGNMNSEVRKILKKIKEKKVGFIGTLGAEPDSEHGKKVYEKAKALCSKNNDFIGGYLCLGEVAPKLIEMMKKFPLNLIHPYNEKRRLRIEKANGHPNSQDLEDIKIYFEDILKKNNL